MSLRPSVGLVRARPAARLRMTVCALALVFLASSACRDEQLCVETFFATCQCDDPTMPDLTTCVASSQVDTCMPYPDFDPCVRNPCCRLARTDGGDASSRLPDLSPTDLASGGDATRSGG